MYRLFLPKSSLWELYIQEGLTTSQIAERYNCCQTTVWKRLHEYGIKPRFPWNATDLTKEKLQHWYLIQKLSTWKIEKQYNYSRGTVHRKLKEFGIMTRSPSESHISVPREDFAGDVQDKAYLLGFARGDLRTRRIGDTIHADCGSTKRAQIQLIKELFTGYGNVWIGKPSKEKKVQIEANLNLSFVFLLGKEIPRWVYTHQNFFPFLAGFSDAEGSFFITKKGLAAYSLGNYNKKLLAEIRQNLLSRGIRCGSLSEGKIRDRIEKDGYGHKQNYWQLRVSSKESLLRFFDFLEPFVRHADKKNCNSDRTSEYSFSQRKVWKS